MNSQREINFDNNATTSPLPEVIAAVNDAMTGACGNPSSNHRAGARARQLLTTSRAAIAELIGVEPESVTFTSGATEANNWVIQRTCLHPKARLITSEIEHSSIKSLAEMLESHGTAVIRVRSNSSGRVDLQQLADTITPETSLVSVQWVNSETGVIQPVEEIARLCRSNGVLFHIDASAAVEKFVADVEKLGLNFSVISDAVFPKKRINNNEMILRKKRAVTLINSREQLPHFLC